RILVDTLIVSGYLLPLGFFLWGLERLMRRVPNAKLATQSRLLWIGILVHGVICFAVRQMRWFIENDKDMAMLLLSFSGVAVLIGLVLAGFTIQLLRAAEGTLRNAAR